MVAHGISARFHVFPRLCGKAEKKSTEMRRHKETILFVDPVVWRHYNRRQCFPTLKLSRDL